jgi:hypothetical protein
MSNGGLRRHRFVAGIISWTGNEKRDRERPNLTWEEYVKRDLKD